jgi:hypothetical protein
MHFSFWPTTCFCPIKVHLNPSNNVYLDSWNLNIEHELHTWVQGQQMLSPLIMHACAHPCGCIRWLLHYALHLIQCCRASQLFNLMILWLHIRGHWFELGQHSLSALHQIPRFQGTLRWEYDSIMCMCHGTRVTLHVSQYMFHGACVTVHVSRYMCHGTCVK